MRQHCPSQLAPLALIAVALVAGACSWAYAGQGWHAESGTAAQAAADAPASPTSAAAPSVAAPASAPATVAPAAAAPAPSTPGTSAGVPITLNLTIVTGDMTGKADWPAYIPSDFALPAHATVVVIVTNFDDATPLPAASRQFAQATGVQDNTFTVTPFAAANPNSATGPTVSRTALDPTQVSHTFTIPSLGINVPIAPHARTTFILHTGAPGTYAWRCMDPCGTGSSGWGGPMAAMRGYMEGTLTVV
jgi:hypothetical protein